MRSPERGFTIIELIVVIAIVAVLAAIVTATTVHYVLRARDTTVKADMSQVAKALHIHYTNNGVYSSFVKPAVALPCDQTYEVNKSDTQFAVFARLCSNTNFYCIDSQGKSAELSSIPSTTECVAGGGQYYCEGGCGEGQECQPGGSGNACVTTGSCGGTCSGCGGLGSNDAFGPYLWMSWMCGNYGGTYCCSYYAGCTWDGGSSSCINASCSGSDSSSCGINCPDGSSCGWQY